MNDNIFVRTKKQFKKNIYPTLFSDYLSTDDRSRIATWLRKKTKCVCYVIKEKQEIVSVLLLSKSTPTIWNLIFIYTVPKFRREGYAYTLLSYVSKEKTIHTTAVNKQVDALFHKVCLLNKSL